MDTEEKLNRDLIDKYLGWENVTCDRNDWDGSLAVRAESPLFPGDDDKEHRTVYSYCVDAFTQSVDSCFRYLVPRLPVNTDVAIYRTASPDSDKKWGCFIDNFANYQVAAIPPMALCRALLAWNGVLTDGGELVGPQWWSTQEVRK